MRKKDKNKVKAGKKGNQIRWSNYRQYWINELAKFKGNDKGFMNFALNFKTSTIKAQVMDLRKN